jgi:hypothetical protein
LAKTKQSFQIGTNYGKKIALAKGIRDYFIAFEHQRSIQRNILVPEGGASLNAVNLWVIPQNIHDTISNNGSSALPQYDDF